MLRMLVLQLPLILCGNAHAQERTYKIGPHIIEAPWARATAASAKVSAGYVKITNTGQEPDRLIGGSVSIATEVEVHEMTMSGGIAKMRRLEGGLEIRPGKTEELKPGGYHLMFMGLRQGLKEGETMKGTLVFEKAGTVGVEYHVVRIGAQKGGHVKHRTASRPAIALRATRVYFANIRSGSTTPTMMRSRWAIGSAQQGVPWQYSSPQFRSPQ